jgi:outer membrane protein with beta-barrel domain
LRKLALLAPVFALLFSCHFASAQQGDIAFGGGTVLSSGTCSLFTGVCPEKGGFYPAVSADVIFHKRIGFEFDTAWRGSQGAYGGSGGAPYRPILTGFNAMYQPRLGKKIGVDLLGGIGLQSTRFYGYTQTSNCVYFGACFTSNHSFLIDVGGGVRYYVWNHFFVRPEVRYYYIVNNTNIFSSDNVFRVGASIGYTIGGPE